MSLTSHLRELRGDRSMSSLARLFGEHGFSCTRQYIWQVESGTRNPSVEMLNAYRKVFGVDGDTLLKLAAKDRRDSRAELVMAADASPLQATSEEHCSEVEAA